MRNFKAWLFIFWVSLVIGVVGVATETVWLVFAAIFGSLLVTAVSLFNIYFPERTDRY